MSFRNISAWAIRNPVPPIVLFVALTLAGIVSFMRMDVNNDPDIDFPIVVVVVNQPGAAPTELETQVTQRVEAALRNLQGVDQITSTVTEGTSQTLVQLDIGTPIDRAVEDVRSAVEQVYENLWDDGGCIAQCEFGPGGRPENVLEVYRAWRRLRPDAM